MLNQCNFIGRLGQDPDLHHTEAGKTIANISIACSESWKDKQSGEKKEKTEWVRGVAFGKLAEIIGEYLHKGSQIFISGKMQTRKWEDKDGNDRWTTEIVINEMKMLGSKGDNSSSYDSAPQQQNNAPANDELDQVIPF